ncbi:MAG: InlB B-repeat-containing protein, partial [Clostridiales bacterium]|nr:InlB B-repeat-containing protein [Clostridiales bacterium]
MKLFKRTLSMVIVMIMLSTTFFFTDFGWFKSSGAYSYSKVSMNYYLNTSDSSANYAYTANTFDVHLNSSDKIVDKLVTAYGSSASDTQNLITKAGCQIVRRTNDSSGSYQDFNEDAGGKYAYVGYRLKQVSSMGSTDAAKLTYYKYATIKAMRGLQTGDGEVNPSVSSYKITAGSNPAGSTTYNGVDSSWYTVGRTQGTNSSYGLYYENTGDADADGEVDLNNSVGGRTIKLYASEFERCSPGMTSLLATNNSSWATGYTDFAQRFDNPGEPQDFNRGAGGKTIWLFWKSSLDAFHTYELRYYYNQACDLLNSDTEMNKYGGSGGTLVQAVKNAADAVTSNVKSALQDLEKYGATLSSALTGSICNTLTTNLKTALCNCKAASAECYIVPKNAGENASNVGSAGYWTYLTITSFLPLTAVTFPTWTGDSQDDIIWGTGTLDSGTNGRGNTVVYKYQTKIADHNNEVGTYNTHVYTTDSTGANSYCAAIKAVKMIKLTICDNWRSADNDMQYSYTAAGYRYNSGPSTSTVKFNNGYSRSRVGYIWYGLGNGRAYKTGSPTLTTAYKYNAAVPSSLNSCTLYCLWNYNLTIDPNGGTFNPVTWAGQSSTTSSKEYTVGPMLDTSYYNWDITDDSVRIYQPLRTGYHFDDWTLTNNPSNTNSNTKSKLWPADPRESDFTHSTYNNNQRTLKQTNSTGFTGDKWWNAKYENFSVQAGHRYRLSGWIKVVTMSATGGTPDINLRFAKENNDYASSCPKKNFYASDAGSWKYFEIYRTFDAATTTAHFEFYTCSLKNMSNINIELLFADLQVDEVNTSTDEATTPVWCGSWYIRDGGGSSPSNYNAETTATIKANWEANTYTVKYDANGGSLISGQSTPSNVSATYDTTFTSAGNVYEKAHYHQNGWNTKADGTGTHFAAAASIKNVGFKQGATYTLYAQWEIDTHKLDLNWKYMDSTGNNSVGNAKNSGYAQADVYKNGSKVVSATGDSYTDTAYGTSWKFVASVLDSTKYIIKKDDGTYAATAEKTGTMGDSNQGYSFQLMPIYTIAFNGNGSTGGSTSNYTGVAYDQSKTLTNGFERKYTVTYNYNSATGGNTNPNATATYTFSKWNTAANGSGTDYSGGASVNKLTDTAGGTVTMYAQWNSASVTLPTPTRLGYDFGKWWPTSDFSGSTSYSGGATYTPTANCTLYAKWNAKTYKLTLDEQSATTSGTTGVWYKYQTAKYYSNSDCSTQITTISVPSRTGYAFGGYYTEENGGGTQYITDAGAFTNSPYTILNGKTLYAKWTIQSYNLDLNWNYVNSSGTNNVVDAKTAGYASADVYNPNTTKIATDVGDFCQAIVYNTTWKIVATAKTNYIIKKSDGTYVASETKSGTKGTGTTDARFTVMPTYTIAFNGNGATGGSTASITGVPYDKSQALTTNGFERKPVVTYHYNNATGGNSTPSATATYTFDGWATSSGGSVVYNNGTSVSQLSDTAGATVTLFAKWTSASVTLPTPTKTGYTFAKWWPTSDFSGSTSYSANTAYTPTANCDLYAKWTANQYKVAFDKNGVSGSNSAPGDPSSATLKVTYGIAYPTLPTISRNFYTFDGWYTAKSGGTKVEEGHTVGGRNEGITASTPLYSSGTAFTLYAHWTAKKYTIAFDENKGSGSSDPNTVTDLENVAYDGAYSASALPTPTRNGYTFSSWQGTNLSTSGTFTATKDNVLGANSEVSTSSSTVTLKAVWTKKDITLKWNSDGGS